MVDLEFWRCAICRAHCHRVAGALVNQWSDRLNCFVTLSSRSSNDQLFSLAMINSLNRRLVAVAVFVGWGICYTVRGGELECHKLAQYGTKRRTLCSAPRVGPTVLIVGGIHGNEPAGGACSGRRSLLADHARLRYLDPAGECDRFNGEQATNSGRIPATFRSEPWLSQAGTPNCPTVPSIRWHERRGNCLNREGPIGFLIATKGSTFTTSIQRASAIR